MYYIKMNDDNINNMFNNMIIAKPCNICKKVNNNKNKNCCNECQLVISMHYENCSCIYCR
jgi:hypothetical protein